MGGTGAAADGGCWALQLKGPLKPAVGLLQLWVTALLLLGRTPESQGRGQRARRSFLPHPHAETLSKPDHAQALHALGCLYVFIHLASGPSSCFLWFWWSELILIGVSWSLAVGLCFSGSTGGAASGWVGQLFVSCVRRSTLVQQPKLPLWTPPHQH